MRPVFHQKKCLIISRKERLRVFFDAFEEIDKIPIAAASVGQVHRARLKTGEEVVIKVIKAQNEKSFRRDESECEGGCVSSSCSCQNYARWVTLSRC